MAGKEPTLTVLFDPKDPYSYLAMAPTLALARDTGSDCRWFPFLGRPARPPEPPGDASDRGTHHRWHRARYQQQDLCRYAQARRLPARHFRGDGLYRPSEGTMAAMGFNWAVRVSEAAALDFLGRVFEGYWDGGLDVDSVSDVEAVLADAGIDLTAFEAYCTDPGPTELADQRAMLVERGAFTAPAVLFDGEAYVGRQHLSYLRYRLEQR